MFMLYSFANAVLVCFGVYAAFSSIVVMVALLKELPDLLADGLDAVVTTGARVVRPGATKEQVDSWQEAAFAYFLGIMGIGFLLMLGNGLALLLV
ncbi:hypothetical protein [uncultured Roseovarius sp.]|uniref:hypothetical protein n=1 Tax=uncultured Roseovarius sp. TaxID=293344 RepID=UPI0026394353|nr:hypothetical protein [uncultured Roseovarius sp.]